MLMMQVGRVWMLVRLRFVPMAMAMLTGEGWIVGVVVVTVVVAVGVFMLHRFVRVLVAVRFRYVQVDPAGKEHEGK